MVLNIFLGITAFGQRDGYSGITRAEMSRALEQAKKAGITVSAALPRQIQAAPFLSLKPYEFVPENMAKTLLGTDMPTQQQASSELRVWTHEGRRVTWVASGAVLYIDEGERTKTDTVSAQKARAVTEDFLSEKGLLFEDARLDFVAQTGPSRYIVQYCQDFQGTPVFGGYITVTVDAGGVDRLRFLWFNPIGLGLKRRTLIPATDCLVKIAPAVTQILGDTSELTSLGMGYLSEGIDARQWDAFPVWRFEFSKRYYIYVNAYTGEIDKTEEIG